MTKFNKAFIKGNSGISLSNIPYTQLKGNREGFYGLLAAAGIGGIIMIVEIVANSYSRGA